MHDGDEEDEGDEDAMNWKEGEEDNGENLQEKMVVNGGRVDEGAGEDFFRGLFACFCVWSA